MLATTWPAPQLLLCCAKDLATEQACIFFKKKKGKACTRDQPPYVVTQIAE
jgi:hypothetical protein